MPINKVPLKRLQAAGRALRWPWPAVTLAVCLTAACTSAGTPAAAGPTAATLPAVAAAGR
ncbi:MAG: hypothetical protein ACRDOI_36275 [Trebonia sp.]